MVLFPASRNNSVQNHGTKKNRKTGKYPHPHIGILKGFQHVFPKPLRPDQRSDDHLQLTKTQRISPEIACFKNDAAAPLNRCERGQWKRVCGRSIPQLEQGSKRPCGDKVCLSGFFSRSGITKYVSASGGAGGGWVNPKSRMQSGPQEGVMSLAIHIRSSSRNG